MVDIWGALSAEVTVPQWYLAAIGAASMVVGFAACFLVSYRRALLKVFHREGRMAPATTASHEAPMPLVPATSPVSPVPLLKRTPVPPVRQHYWYYVSGVTGRFATLREALVASGVVVLDNKPLDWKKLTVGTRDRIKRVRVNNEQAVMTEAATQPVVTVKETRNSPGKTVTPADETEQVIKKPIGNGAFVTFKKKTK